MEKEIVLDTFRIYSKASKKNQDKHRMSFF